MNLFYIDCRQSGKTTKLVNELFSCIDRNKPVYFFVPSLAMGKHIIDGVRRKAEETFDRGIFRDRRFDTVNLKQIIRVPSEDLLFRIETCTPDTHVLVDEYLFMRDKEKSVLYRLYLQSLNQATWTIRTTSNKMYRKDILELVHRIKEDSPNSDSFSYMIRKFLREVDQKDFDELWGNLLSEPRFKIKSRQLDMEKAMSREQFELEMLGRFLSE